MADIQNILSQIINDSALVVGFWKILGRNFKKILGAICDFYQDVKHGRARLKLDRYFVIIKQKKNELLRAH